MEEHNKMSLLLQDSGQELVEFKREEQGSYSKNCWTNCEGGIIEEFGYPFEGVKREGWKAERKERKKKII